MCEQPGNYSRAFTAILGTELNPKIDGSHEGIQKQFIRRVVDHNSRLANNSRAGSKTRHSIARHDELKIVAEQAKMAESAEHCLGALCRALNPERPNSRALAE
jgi:hypothetical protein